jgi:hypothetical protein
MGAVVNMHPIRVLAAQVLILVTMGSVPATAADPEPTEEEDWRILAGSIVMGTGIAAIVAGATVGTVAAAKYADLECPEDTCPPEIFDDAQDYNALRTPAGLTIAAGGLLSAVGGALLFAAFTDQRDTSVSFEASPQFMGVRGRF